MTLPLFRDSELVKEEVAVPSITGGGALTRVDGDLLVALLFWRNVGAADVTPPTGWMGSNKLTTGIFHNRGQLFWKIAASEPATWTWTLNATSTCVLVLHAYDPSGYDYDESNEHINTATDGSVEVPALEQGLPLGGSGLRLFIAASNRTDPPASTVDIAASEAPPLTQRESTLFSTGTQRIQYRTYDELFAWPNQQPRNFVDPDGAGLQVVIHATFADLDILPFDELLYVIYDYLALITRLMALPFSLNAQILEGLEGPEWLNDESELS